MYVNIKMVMVMKHVCFSCAGQYVLLRFEKILQFPYSEKIRPLGRRIHRITKQKELLRFSNEKVQPDQ